MRVRDKLLVRMSDGAARTTLACLYDRRAALSDHVARKGEEVSDYELSVCRERLAELDEAIAAVAVARNGREPE